MSVGGVEDFTPARLTLARERRGMTRRHLAELVSVLEQEPLVGRAITEAFAELDSERPKRQAELGRVEAELRRRSGRIKRRARQQVCPA